MEKSKFKPKHGCVTKKHLEVFRRSHCSLQASSCSPLLDVSRRLWNSSRKPQPFDSDSGKLTAALLQELETEANKLLERRGTWSLVYGDKATIMWSLTELQWDSRPHRMGKDLNGKLSVRSTRRKCQDCLLNIPKKWELSLEKIQRRFRGDRLLFQKK